jgi:methyltransferase (TIGR00027 family)
MALVAVEQLFPRDRRIVVDDLARAILPFGARTFLWLVRPSFVDWIVRAAERKFPGLWGGIMCRKRYIDEKLIESAGQIDAVVNLGAGFDTRAYRLTALARMPVWEVDQAENINPKRARLRKLLGAVPAHVTLVSTISIGRSWEPPWPRMAMRTENGRSSYGKR